MNNTLEKYDVPKLESFWDILVGGEPYPDLPKDLYIPPDALRVFLEIFEGPLDLLLYLIRRNNLDILNIPVATITKQYIEYIDIMENMRIEVAAEYLEMAAILTEIKSKMLLPRTKEEEEEEIDPRQELARKLQEYETIKQAAIDLDQIPRKERDIFLVKVKAPDLKIIREDPDVSLKELMLAFKDVLKRADLETSHNIERETVSVRERMSIILEKLENDKFMDFINFFTIAEGKVGVVVTFLAILEMVKENILEVVQSEQFAPIYVRLKVC